MYTPDQVNFPANLPIDVFKQNALRRFIAKVGAGHFTVPAKVYLPRRLYVNHHDTDLAGKIPSFLIRDFTRFTPRIARHYAEQLVKTRSFSYDYDKINVITKQQHLENVGDPLINERVLTANVELVLHSIEDRRLKAADFLRIQDDLKRSKSEQEVQYLAEQALHNEKYIDIMEDADMAPFVVLPT